MSFNPAVGRQESMRWAAPEHAYDGGDWEEDLDERDEDEHDVEDVASILSADLAVDSGNEPGDYRNIYEYYEDDDPKRRSVQEQLEEEIFQSLTPGHSRHTSVESQIEVDPSIAELYQGTSQYLARPISVYAETAPLSIGTSDSDRHIQALLSGANGSLDDDTPVPTPVAPVSGMHEPLHTPATEATTTTTATAAATPPALDSKRAIGGSESSLLSRPNPLEDSTRADAHDQAEAHKTVEPKLYSVAEQPAPETRELHHEPEPEYAPPHVPEPLETSPEPVQERVVSDTDSFKELKEAPKQSAGESAEEPAGQSVGFPSLALTCATPEASDTEEADEDLREKPDWQPRWRPETESKPKHAQESSAGVNLHESQISLDMSDTQSLQSVPSDRMSFIESSSSRKPSVQSGFVDSVVGSGSDSDTDTNTIEAPSLEAEADGEGDADAADSLAESREPKEAAPAPEPKRISRAPVVDMKAVFALQTSLQRQQMLSTLREREAEYSTQLETWLASTYDAGSSAQAGVFVTGAPPETEAHALPVSRQVGTALGQSGSKTKETLVKVGDRGKKGLNAMKKLMRH